ncbi:DUF309 domain-containing protein [Brevibacillus sp. NRS-1366]|uniref:DUF309 domain-containing protein n=1 Tax=Brevibacillus sp. NRS-1366 TaxID=3233899 RepID=UPI003D1B43FB
MYPQSYLDYLVQFHVDRDYFECHEILEEYWKSAPPKERRPVWVGLIQIAVALYHQRRGNQSGAIKMLTSAISLVEEHQGDIQALGLDSKALHDLLAERLDDMKQGKAYHSLSLPITDQSLQQAYEQACAIRNTPKERASNMEDSYLLNKHTLRDRSDVHAERLRQLQLREERRTQQSDQIS